MDDGRELAASARRQVVAERRAAVGGAATTLEPHHVSRRDRRLPRAAVLRPRADNAYTARAQVHDQDERTVLPGQLPSTERQAAEASSVRIRHAPAAALSLRLRQPVREVLFHGVARGAERGADDEHERREEDRLRVEQAQGM